MTQPINEIAIPSPDTRSRTPAALFDRWTRPPTTLAGRPRKSGCTEMSESTAKSKQDLLCHLGGKTTDGITADRVPGSAGWKNSVGQPAEVFDLVPAPRSDQRRRSVGVEQHRLAQAAQVVGAHQRPADALFGQTGVASVGVIRPIHPRLVADGAAELVQGLQVALA